MKAELQSNYYCSKKKKIYIEKYHVCFKVLGVIIFSYWIQTALIFVSWQPSTPLMLVVHWKRFLQHAQKDHSIQTPGMLTSTELALFQNSFSVLNQKSAKIYEQNILQDIFTWEVVFPKFCSFYTTDLFTAWLYFIRTTEWFGLEGPFRSSHSNPAPDFHQTRLLRDPSSLWQLSFPLLISLT